MNNIELYKHFYMVIKYKNISRAANELKVSQSEIYASIKSLESQIGSPVFDYSTKLLELTTEGKILYSKIKPTFDMISNASDGLKALKIMNDEYSKLPIKLKK